MKPLTALIRRPRFMPYAQSGRAVATLLTALLLILLQACNSAATREAELAAMDAERAQRQQEIADQALAEAARIAAEQEAVEAAASTRRAEQERLESERRRQLELARIAAEQEQQRLAEEQIRRAAAARVQAERQEKLARIESLQNQIAELEVQVSSGDSANARYREAIAVAEELLAVLTEEQAKYDEVDADGNLLQPLSKDRIAELQSRKDNLVQEAQNSIP